MTERLAANLWRWTAPSPHWTPDKGVGPDAWPQDVGCVLYVRDGTATVIDPLVAPGDDARWAFLDDATTSSRVVVALTAPWHRRSAAERTRRGEVAYWIPEHGVLVTAEVLQGRPDGLRYGVSPAVSDRDALEAWLRALDRLPIELVLPTHGPPAPGGRAAIPTRSAARRWA